jgi:hypothetical protein
MFYHGTSVLLSVGDTLRSPACTGVIQEAGRKKNLDKVFFTKDLGSAKIYAGRAGNAFGSNERYVYRVEPVGSMDCLNNNPGTSVFMADSAIIIEVIEV